MVRAVLGILLLAYPWGASAQPSPRSLAATPAALPLFERDWVLMNWALKLFDSNRDILLQPNEAQSAATAFRDLADTNHDGRITPQEYAAARAEILTRE